MARFPRVCIPGCPHHVVQRGNRKVDVFQDDSDRLVYIRLMHDACETYHVDVWSYSLMDNHVHLIQVPEKENSLSRAVQDAHSEYSRYLNTKYSLVGHAWQGRFKSVAMEEAHCWNAIRYVERNPVRAGLVTNAEDYLWSSAAAHCGLRGDTLLSGNCPLVPEIKNWSEWLSVEDKGAEDLIRRRTRIGRPLGSEEFVRRFELQTGRELLPKKRGPRRKSDPAQKKSEGEQGQQPPFPLFG